jgi:hypothetical protein
VCESVATATSAAPFARGAAEWVNRTAPATLEAASAYRIAKSVTFFDYPGPIGLSQGRSDI